MGHGLVAVIFNKTAKLIGLDGPEKGVELVIGIEGVIVPVGAFLDAPVGAPGNGHGDGNDGFGVREIGDGAHQLGCVPEALDITDGNTFDPKLFGLFLEDLRCQFHDQCPLLPLLE